jgi:hypothetical protein
MPYADRERRLAYLRDYRRTNRDPRDAAARSRSKVEQLRALTKRLKEEHPCADCGEHYPYYVMDFDHVRGVKEFEVRIATASRKGWSRIYAEIAKCDIVCANCHRVRTWDRMHSAPLP